MRSASGASVVRSMSMPLPKQTTSIFVRLGPNAFCKFSAFARTPCHCSWPSTFTWKTMRCFAVADFLLACDTSRLVLEKTARLVMIWLPTNSERSIEIGFIAMILCYGLFTCGNEAGEGDDTMGRDEAVGGATRPWTACVLKMVKQPTTTRNTANPR